jgi:L-2-hydroxyglutarate oxidase LhgO
VIHGGLYYPCESLKARLCVQGKRQLYHYCQERNIPYNQCGKLIVATKPGQIEHELEGLRRQALQNGVTDVKILSQADVNAIEPDIQCIGGALWSPSTGVLDSHSFMTCLVADAEAEGTTIAFNTKVKEASVESTGSLLLRFDDDTRVVCDSVVNAAGLWAPQIAQLFHHGQGSWHPPRAYFAKGTYFKLQGVRPLPFQHLIYPIPEPGGLGVHATIDWAGQGIKFGPDVEWVDPSVEDPSTISLRPDPQRGVRFYEQVRKYWPDLPNDALVPDYVGIRPKLNHPSQGTLEFQDFLIAGQATHGVKGLVHLLGIESPGLTSSMAIGDYVASQL